MTRGFEFIEHTADIRLRARGASLGELYAHAARGLAAYLFGDEILGKRAEGFEQVSLVAPDRESLLVDWLSHLLFLTATNYRAYPDIKIDSISEVALSAQVGWVSANAIEDVKAITHYDLKILEHEGLFEATVTFDI